MKMIVLLFSVFLAFNAQAALLAGTCEGEAQVIAAVSSSSKEGMHKCKAFIDNHNIPVFNPNITCPIEINEVVQQGVYVGIKDGHDCALVRGDQLNGIIVKRDGEFHLEGPYDNSYNVFLNGHDVPAKVISALKATFAKQCRFLLRSVNSLHLAKIKMERQKIDQGYVNHIWTMTFEIQYTDYRVGPKDTVFVQITEGIEDRDGVLDIHVDTFETHYGSDDDAICI